MKTAFRGRSLTTLLNYTGAELRQLLALSARIKTEAQRRGPSARLRNKTIALFLRNGEFGFRSVAEPAVAGEGGFPSCFLTEGIAELRTGNIEDLARRLGRTFNAIGWGGGPQEEVEKFSEFSGIPVVNLGSERFDPLGALADILTMESSLGRVGKGKIAFLGDGRSPIASSLMVACAKLGLGFSLAAPRAFCPDAELLRLSEGFAQESGGSVVASQDVEAALSGADVLYAGPWLVSHPGRPEAERVPESYRATASALGSTGNPACMLFCAPGARSQAEVSAELFESRASRAFEQEENRLFATRALFLALL